MLPIYDFCLFNNEFEMLELRLRYMQRFVSKFFVGELDLTYQGDLKGYHSDEFLSKYEIGRRLVEEGRLVFVKMSNPRDESYFAIEHEHRRAFSRWVTENVDRDFMGLLCDCDEIVDESVGDHLDIAGDFANLDLKMYYFAADNYSYKQSWTYVKLFHSRILKSCDFQNLRMSGNDTVISGMGWHFSSFGGHSQVADKLKSFSHREFNRNEHSDKWTLIHRMKNRQDYLGRVEFPCEEFDPANYPESLLEIIVEKPHFSSISHLFGTFEEMLLTSSSTDCDAFVQAPLVPDEAISRQVEVSQGVFQNLYVLYHVACMGDWRALVSEQLEVVRSSGLTQVSVSILGTSADCRYLMDLARDLGLSISIEYHSEDLENYEFPAMVLLGQWCRNHPEGNVLYFHSKGVSLPGNSGRRNWRRLMEKYVIGGWRDNCLALGNGYDVAGVNWRNMEGRSHFTGNFFVASSSYIRSLAGFGDFFRSFLDGRGSYHPRMAAEFWLGSGNSLPRFLSHVSYDEDMTSSQYWEKYRSLLPPEGDLVIGEHVGRISIRYGHAAHGTIGLGGHLGYEGLTVSHPDHPDLTISAHADSLVIIEISAMVRIYGFLNGTAADCKGVMFHVDGIHLGTVHERNDVSDGLLLAPGIHELRAVALDGIGFCHTVWCLEFIEPQIDV